MNFYTNVIQWGNSLLVRGLENNQRVNKRVQYEPTLFDLVNEPTGYKTLDGRHVRPNKFDSIREAREWYNDRKDQDIIFGNNNSKNDNIKYETLDKMNKVIDNQENINDRVPENNKDIFTDTLKKIKLTTFDYF